MYNIGEEYRIVFDEPIVEYIHILALEALLRQIKKLQINGKEYRVWETIDIHAAQDTLHTLHVQLIVANSTF